MRDHRGGILGRKNLRFESAVSVFEAETIGANEALSWIFSKYTMSPLKVTPFSQCRLWTAVISWECF